MSGDNQLNISDKIRGSGSDVFKNRELLVPSRIVGEDRIVGREKEINELIDKMSPLMDGGKPPNLFVYGPSGTGKSLITNYIANEYRDAMAEEGIDLAIIPFNCQWLQSNFQACEKIAEGASKLDKIDGEVSVSGLSTHKALTHIFNTIEEHYHSCLIIIDEIDLLVNPSNPNSADPEYSSLLYQLSRIDDLVGFSRLGVVCLTNSPDFMSHIDSRVQSSFNPTDIQFSDYDAAQLRSILKHRKDAFYPGVLGEGEGVIQLSAAFAAQDHGDARKAIDLLRTAGQLADEEDTDDPVVTEDHVRKAQQEVAKDRVIEIAQGYSTQKKLVLFSAAAVAAWSDSEGDEIPNPALMNVYEYVCDKIGTTAKSRDTVLRYMSEFQTNGLVESNLQSRGNKAGVYKEYQLNRSPDILTDVLLEDEPHFEDIIADKELVITVVKTSLNEFYS